MHYNRYRYYSPYVGRFISKDPIGLNGGFNSYQYAPNTIQWVDTLGLNKYFIGKMTEMPYKASALKPLTPHSKEWMEALAAAKTAVALCKKFQVRTNSSTNAKLFLFEAFGNMNRYKVGTNNEKREPGQNKYTKGYEQHQAPENLTRSGQVDPLSKHDLQHLKYYMGCTDGHVFYTKPN